MEAQFQPGNFDLVWALKVSAGSDDLDLIEIILI